MAEDPLYRGDFHIHSKFSYDSNNDLRYILKKASNLGMNVISITDHGTMKGSLEAQEVAKKYGIEVWPGMEITTNVGDIIGLRLKEEVRARFWEDVIQEIRDQGGLVILPHPYRGHKNIEELATSVDIIEIFNGHDSPDNVIRSAELARKYRKPGIAGSDAHVSSEIGKAINIFQDIMSPDKAYFTKSSNRFEKTYSRLVKDMKMKQYGKIPGEVLNLLMQ